MQSVPTDAVDLTLPADPRFSRLARMMASGVAAEFGASEDAVMELRLAVDEACAVLIEQAEVQATLQLVCTVEQRQFVVTVTSSAPSRGPLRPHPVAEAILAWSVASYDVDCDERGRDRIRLVKPLDP